MTPDKNGASKKNLVCSNCHAPVDKGTDYLFKGKVLCEACCLRIRSPRMRKTHWQYIKSVKADYLKK
jgi:recombinational DNA repair protein (RecF pathway)